MGVILNIKCKNCSYEDNFFVGYGNLGAIDLSTLLDELNNKEEALIQTKLDTNELDQTVLTHRGLMQCKICLKIDCKLRFNFFGKTAQEEFTPFCDKCSHKMDPIIEISDINCSLCGEQSLVHEDMGVWD